MGLNAIFPRFNPNDITDIILLSLFSNTLLNLFVILSSKIWKPNGNLYVKEYSGLDLSLDLLSNNLIALKLVKKSFCLFAIDDKKSLFSFLILSNNVWLILVSDCIWYLSTIFFISLSYEKLVLNIYFFWSSWNLEILDILYIN